MFTSGKLRSRFLLRGSIEIIPRDFAQLRLLLLMLFSWHAIAESHVSDVALLRWSLQEKGGRAEAKEGIVVLASYK